MGDIIQEQGMDLIKWRLNYKKTNIIIFFIIVAMELLMSLILWKTNMIYQEAHVYIKRFLIRPIVWYIIVELFSMLLVLVIKNDRFRNAVPLLAITGMFGVLTVIHNVFVVTMLLFCIPIFMSVVFRDRMIPFMIFMLSIAFIDYEVFYCYTEDDFSRTNPYFVPAVIISVVVLIVCKKIADMLIDLQQIQYQKVIDSMNEARNAEERAVKANESKSMFLSNMSHEIRTPINAVLGMDEMILRGGSEEEIREYAENIKTAGNTLLSLINDILDFSKLESGKMNIVNAEYDVSSLINDLVLLITPRVEKSGLLLKLNIDKDIPCRLYGDDVRISQVITNLLTNAVKYTKKGFVTLSVRCIESGDDTVTLKIAVADTGMGIKDEDKEGLFTAFQRVDELNNRNIEGAGLGLNICSTLLQLMDSRLEFNSTYGKGSVFFFEIKQKIVDRNAIGDYAQRRRNAERSEKYQALFTAPDAKILVVDDNNVVK